MASTATRISNSKEEATRGRLTVVLVSPRNPLNIGAAARAMSNFGFTDLRLVNPYDVAFREAVSAVKSHYILEGAKVFENLADAVADCSLIVGTTSLGRRDLHAPLHRLESAATLVKRQWETARVALLFGSEKFGLSNDDLSHCHYLLRIPTRNEHGSMNLGQAVSICLYELSRNSRAASQQFPARANATNQDLERINALLLEILSKSSYINERTRHSTELKLRRLIKRLHLPAHDAEVWLGIFRQILWRIDRGSCND
jgi:TrmH family RNA methyltransferase